MRVYALVAIAEGRGQAVLSALPSVTYHSGDDPADEDRARGRRLVYSRGGEDYVVLLQRLNTEGVDLGVASAAPSGDWDVWCLVADSRDIDEGRWRWVAAALRWLRGHGDPDYLRGPWAIPHAVELRPELAPLIDRIATLAGDDRARVLAVDYRPTQQEIDEDTDPDPGTLFGGEPS